MTRSLLFPLLLELRRNPRRPQCGSGPDTHDSVKVGCKARLVEVRISAHGGKVRQEALYSYGFVPGVELEDPAGGPRPGELTFHLTEDDEDWNLFDTTPRPQGDGPFN